MVMLAVYITFRKGDGRDLQIAVLLVAVPLASPYGYNYDLTLLSVAVLWAFDHASRRGFLTGERVLLAVAWLLPILVVPANIRGIPIAPAVLALLFAALLVRANGWMPAITPAARRQAGAAAPR
jgi:hypothetical protein